MPVSFERHKQLLTKKIGLSINLRDEREQNPTHNKYRLRREEVNQQ